MCHLNITVRETAPKAKQSPALLKPQCTGGGDKCGAGHEGSQRKTQMQHSLEQEEDSTPLVQRQAQALLESITQQSTA